MADVRVGQLLDAANDAVVLRGTPRFVADCVEALAGQVLEERVIDIKLFLLSLLFLGFSEDFFHRFDR